MTTSPLSLRVAHSPDADDAFMFYGLHAGATDCRGLRIERVTSDIESLNRRAVAAELDVTAVSFAAWPRFSEAYDLLTVGSSFGLGYGPKLVSLRPLDLSALAGRRVAVPGELTSAALVLRLCLPSAETVAVPFDRVAACIEAGDVDAGVVIHEGQLTYAREGLDLVLDLGAWWAEQTGGLPLPLGANVVRRSLGRDVIATFKEVMADSIRHALDNRSDALAHALTFARGVDVDTAGEFVALYVNELTLEPGAEGRRAVAELYRRAHRAGLLDPVEPRWA